MPCILPLNWVWTWISRILCYPACSPEPTLENQGIYTAGLLKLWNQVPENDPLSSCSMVKSFGEMFYALSPLEEIHTKVALKDCCKETCLIVLPDCMSLILSPNGYWDVLGVKHYAWPVRQSSGHQWLPIIHYGLYGASYPSGLLSPSHSSLSGPSRDSWDIPACSCLRPCSLSRECCFPQNSHGSLPHFLQVATQDRSYLTTF